MLKRKVIRVPFINEVELGFFGSKKILIAKIDSNCSKYFLIPSSIYCQSYKKSLVLSLTNYSKEDLVVFNNFCKFLLKEIRNIKIPIKKRLLLTGLGYKMTLSSDLKNLELKLGLSHIVSLNIPKLLTVSIQKNILLVEGYDKDEVGSFINKIRSLKVPDSYKGKGFWYKYETMVLKEIKKK